MKKKIILYRQPFKHTNTQFNFSEQDTYIVLYLSTCVYHFSFSPWTGCKHDLFQLLIKEDKCTIYALLYDLGRMVTAFSCTLINHIYSITVVHGKNENDILTFVTSHKTMLNHYHYHVRNHSISLHLFQSF